MSKPLYPEVKIELIDIPEWDSKRLKITKIIMHEEIDEIGLARVLIGISDSIKKYAEGIK